MKQHMTIGQLRMLFQKVKGLDVALLYGSFGRNEATPNSDVDIQLLVNEGFEDEFLVEMLQKEFKNDIVHIHDVKMRNKIVVYFKSQPKVEFAICSAIGMIDRDYLGSEISNITDSILYERPGNDYRIETYLRQLVSDHNQNKASQQKGQEIADLIDKFIYEFESCSTMHRRSDGFQFYFFYNIALQVVVQLKQLSTGQNRFKFLPKNFIAKSLNEEEQKPFYDLHGALFLPEANQQKRKLLDFFYSASEPLISAEKQNEIKELCEWVYNRDFHWNFRDISTYNSKIKSGIIFRSATLTSFQHEKHFNDWLIKENIRTVIDLRADTEIDETPYSDQSLSKFKYVKAPFDPWNQPKWFEQNHKTGTNVEIAYRFFAMCCKGQIKGAIEAILNEPSGSVVVHCAAGKDRTGILVSLLHLLTESSLETVYSDYLASEVDVKRDYLKIVLDYIKGRGGIEPYLLECGLSINQLSVLKQKLLN